MTDLNQWKQAIQVHIPAFETFLENGLHQPYTVQLKNTATGSTEEAEQEIRQADKVVRFIEKKFYSEIFFGFAEDWLAALIDQLPSTPQQENIGDELLLELSTNFMDMIAGALAEAGIEIEIASMDIITDDKLARAFNLQQYFRANLHAEPASKDEQTAPALDLWIAASHPDEEMIADYLDKLSDDNPFANGKYSKIAVRFAEHSTMVQQQNSNSPYDAGISMKGQQVEFEDFGHSNTTKNMREVRNIDILKDVGMHVSVELGRREMPLGKILHLVKGSVIELEKLAGEPVEILVNGHKIAQGDVVVIDEHFGVRISNLLASQERIKELQ